METCTYRIEGYCLSFLDHLYDRVALETELNVAGQEVDNGERRVDGDGVCRMGDRTDRLRVVLALHNSTKPTGTRRKDQSPYQHD